MAGESDEREQLAATLKRAMEARLDAVTPLVPAKPKPAVIAARAAERAPDALQPAVIGSISFSAALLQAIRAGSKTQTRRPIRPVPASVAAGVAWTADGQSIRPLAQPGERLWVRESWARTGDGGFVYAADQPERSAVRWNPSRFMPREAARTFLQVRQIGIARLGQITEADALAEGAANDPAGCGMFGPRVWFFSLWDAIYGSSEFATRNDPWVWVIGFEKVKINDDRRTMTNDG